MIPRRRKSDDYIGLSTGLMKWVNKLFRFVLFPFIHPLFFITLLVIMGVIFVGIHYYANVGYREVPSWIFIQGKNIWNVVTEKFDKSFVTNVFDNRDKSSSKAENVAEMVKSAQVKSSKNNVVRAVDRKAFRKTQDASADVKLKFEDENYKNKNISSDSLFEFKRDNTIGLTYRKEPRLVIGKAFVVSANEINIDGEDMLLYGIYSLPESQKGKDAALFLKNMIKNKEVECHVVAFTQNAELAAMCAVDGFSINHKMVDMGYSKNVSLK